MSITNSIQSLLIISLLFISNIGTTIAHENQDVNPESINGELPFYDFLNDAFQFTEDEKALLDENGFLVLNRMGTDDLIDAYAYYWMNDLPIFITTDTMLQTWHLIFDKILMKAEEDIFLSLLKNLVIESLEILVSEIDENDFDLATQHSLIYLYTAAKLIDTNTSILSVVEPTVETILNAIYDEITIFDAVSIFTEQPISRFIDDFSQYKPRGHYTESEALGTYFRLFKWLSRIPFFFDNYLGYGYLQTEPIDMIKSAIQLSYAMKNSQIQIDEYDVNANGLEIWQFLENFLNTLIGKTYTVSPMVIFETISFMLGSEDWTLTEMNSNKIADIQEVVLKNSQIPDLQDPETIDAITQMCSGNCSPKTLHVFGERLGLDTFTLNHFVSPYTDNFLPSGLEFAATILESDRAEDYLVNGDQSYVDRIEFVNNKINEFSGVNDETISNSWFNSLSELTVPQPTMNETVITYPEFMYTGPWLDQKLTTVLGSWAQYRHDTILYGKLSYSYIACSTPDAYVEPYPDFYFNLQKTNQLFNTSLNQLSTLNFNLSRWDYYTVNDAMERKSLDTTYFDVLSAFDDVLDKLGQVATFELRGESLPEELETFVRLIFRRNSYDNSQWGWLPDLFALLTTGSIMGDFWSDKPNSRASVVSDVHTDLYNSRNLAVATGYLEHMIVKIPGTEYEEIYAVGPVFSYYEFQTAMDIRMTDEEWRGILTSYTSDSEYNYDIIPRGFWAKNYMVSTSITQGHLYNEHIFDIPEWFAQSEEDIFIENYGLSINNLILPPIESPKLVPNGSSTNKGKIRSFEMIFVIPFVLIPLTVIYKKKSKLFSN